MEKYFVVVRDLVSFYLVKIYLFINTTDIPDLPTTSRLMSLLISAL